MCDIIATNQYKLAMFLVNMQTTLYKEKIVILQAIGII